MPGGGYAAFNGTSMASPHVAGAWAALKRAIPGASVDTILASLQESGVPITDFRGRCREAPHPIARGTCCASAGKAVPRVDHADRGWPGTRLTVTVAGMNFGSGTSVSFGAGITVEQTTVVSATELAATILIATNATLGTRDVTVVDPNGQSATLADAFLVTPAPPILTLRYEGKLRDRVGEGNGLTSPDGKLDATFKVTVEPGSGPRTITQLELWTLNGSGRWDTIPTTQQWMLGATTGSLDGTLHNTSNGSVNFATNDGQTHYLFAPDLSPSLFTAGVQVRLLARLADGSSTTVDTTIVAPPNISSINPQGATPAKPSTSPSAAATSKPAPPAALAPAPTSPKPASTPPPA